MTVPHALQIEPTYQSHWKGIDMYRHSNEFLVSKTSVPPNNFDIHLSRRSFRLISSPNDTSDAFQPCSLHGQPIFSQVIITAWPHHSLKHRYLQCPKNERVGKIQWQNPAAPVSFLYKGDILILEKRFPSEMWRHIWWKPSDFSEQPAISIFRAGKKTFINFYLHPLQKTLAFSHHHKRLTSHILSSSLTKITHLRILRKAECHGDYESLKGRRFEGRSRGIYESILQHSYGKYVW